jgi:2-keto-4-pentenoate hydratase
MISRPENISAAAGRLEHAACTGEPCEPVRDLIGGADLDAAYAVQDLLKVRRVAGGDGVVGRKIGLTSRAVQEQLGVDRPDFGFLFESMTYRCGDTIPAGRVLQPRVEAEIAFILGSDLVDGPLDAEQIHRATDHVAAAVEICGSRIRNWDISFGDTVADNASAGAYVLGDPRPLGDLDTARVEMDMSIDGERVSEGTGAACLGDPIEAVVWLARTSREFGQPLQAGQVVLSGALGPMRPVGAGQTVAANLSGLGRVTVSFG